MNSTDTYYYGPVTNVDWTDVTIKRAGVLPYTIEFDTPWLCFGISNYNSRITTFGGQVEQDDFDLLDTACREFNEEIVQNYPPITPDDLLSCFCIKSSKHVLILYPLDTRKVDFTETKEIRDALWITINQFIAMRVPTVRTLKLEYNSRSSGSNPYAYLFSADVDDCTDGIIDAFTGDIPQYPAPVNPEFVRLQRSFDEENINIKYGIGTFLNDFETKNYWNNGLFTTFDDQAVMGYRDKTVYIFHIDDIPLALTTINELDIGTHRSTTLYTFDETSQLPFYSNIKFRHLYDRNKSPYADILDKVSRLYDAEYTFYTKIRKSGSFFNKKRWEFLDCLKRINNKQPRNRRAAIKLLAPYKNTRYNILNVLENTNVIIF